MACIAGQVDLSRQALVYLKMLGCLLCNYSRLLLLIRYFGPAILPVVKLQMVNTCELYLCIGGRQIVS